MSVRRALVDCAVLSLQDSCVFYPSCRGCFSRIDVEQQDNTRYRCSRCGSRCLREQVDYRYRLSLRVTRDRCIFGVTVFGSSLNPFFGIHASELQKLVENSDEQVEPSTRSSLLVKAVEDCFIGRHFIFGLKASETESGPWFGGSWPNGSTSKDSGQFVASQMILPKAPGLAGCTVISYYRSLLQRVSEYEGGSCDSSKTSRLPAETLLLIRNHSPNNSFSDVTLSASGLSASLQRSKHQDCTLTPTPPWQQSLGVITSSAEQDEGCSTQDSGDENNRQTDHITTPRPAQRGFLENHNITKERSPFPYAQHSFHSSPSFVKYPNSSVKKSVGNSPLNTWFSPSPPGYKRHSTNVKELSAEQLNRTFLSSSLAWEDLPFSESLTAFLCEEKKYSDAVSETASNQNVHHQKETAKNNPEITNVATESTFACQRNTHMAHSPSQILLDVTNPPASGRADRHDLSHHQKSEKPLERVNRNDRRNICSHERNQRDEEDSSQCFEKEDEELQGDTYNCSADLFSSSFMISTNTEMLNTNKETFRTITEAYPLFTKPDQQHQRDENANVAHSTPAKHKLKSSKCTNRDILIPQTTQDFEFVPPSQSTPIVKVGAVLKSPTYLYRNLTGDFSSQPDSEDSEAFYRNLPELDFKKQVRRNTFKASKLFRCGRESTKENVVGSRTSSIHSYRLTTERRSWKPDEHNNHLQAQQHQRMQREALNLGSAGTITHKCDSRVCDDDSEVIVPPTPAGKTQIGATPRRRRQTDTSSSSLGSAWDRQLGDGFNCKRTLLDQTHTSSHTDETVVEGSLDGSNIIENQTCDWSRDLFSDSV